ncbi:hypothetical protein ACJMK2_014861 [Sinanodonta woodiana]|uniref:Phosphatidic acid phosphatase type 2/haloperoxidase domain-containing protein n=1 Tax=Sinanodonta woodiana TaxID=1069815 RepID=A0ABD3V1Y5_SINWO
MSSCRMKKYQALVIVLDVGIFLAVLILSGLLGFDNLGIKPTVRGFFCDDQSLMYPYKPDTVSTELSLVLCALIPAILMAVIEGFHHYQSRPKGQGWKHIQYATACYKTIGVFLFGMGLTMLLGEIAKLVVGRLRPHFFDLCKPDFSKIECFRNNVSVYVNAGDKICTGTKLSLMTDARKSFPSNHASAAFYGFTYFMIYLQVRFIWTRVHLFRPLLQALFMGVALCIGLSRVMDYKHYWSDVLGGAVLGIIVAVLNVRFVSLLPCQRNDIQYTDFSRIHAEKDRIGTQEMKEQV